MRCPGLHCDGCRSGGGFLLPVAVAAAVALSSILATVLADLLDAVLIVALAATAGMVTVLAVKVRRARIRLIQRGPAWSGVRSAAELPELAAAPRRAIEAPREVRPHFTVNPARVPHVR